MTVHGLVSSTHHWLDFNPYYAQTRPVISWDYRGHGGGPPHATSRRSAFAQFADDAHAVWRGDGLRRRSSSSGCRSASRSRSSCGAAIPRCVKALVLICGTAGHPLDRVSASPALRRDVASDPRARGAARAVARRCSAFLRSRIGARLAREIAYLTGGAHRDACPPTMLEGLFRTSARSIRASSAR